ncbi:MAG: hypothetical protein QGH90_07955 [Candidatus Poseidoniaceae archaeon]|jgi:hypothetical protein|nr:hypothetical protein [Candidatus Poseidoniaceae archaeon]
MAVDVLRAVILLAHPLAALILLRWLFRQYSWKKLGHELHGDTRKSALDSHEVWGQRIFPALLLVIAIAFIANAWRGAQNGDWTAELLPTSVHGATGLIGSILLYITWNYGRKVVAQREAGEKWALTKTKHGRAADIIIIIGCIHAFIGFLYIFNVL